MTAAVAGVVLAAGRGSRFGATKQLARLEDRPLVVHVVQAALAAGLAPVVVVVGHDDAAVRAAVDDGSVEVVDNPDHGDGQASSLRAAVRALSTRDVEALVVLLADEPRVAPSAVRAVVAAVQHGAAVARAVYDDRPGHPIAFARSVWPDLLTVSGDQGARQLLDTLEVTPVPVGGPAPVDVDTPADLDAIS